MTEQFYYKEVDTTNRDEMIKFLTTHFRYFTMNSWNGATSYANNVKIYNLGIKDEDLVDKAFDITVDDIERSELDFAMRDVIKSFEKKYKKGVGFNGKSGGYLVLYYTEIGDENEMNVFPGKSLGSDDPEYFEDWTDFKLKKFVALVTAFDKLCDEIREVYITYLEQSEIVEEEEVIVTTRKALKIKDLSM